MKFLTDKMRMEKMVSISLKSLETIVSVNTHNYMQVGIGMIKLTKNIQVKSENFLQWLKIKKIHIPANKLCMTN